MMPNTIVENNPPINPSHVFLGDSYNSPKTHDKNNPQILGITRCTGKCLCVTTNLNKWGSTKEETEHVGHNVITDHTGNGHNEPI